MLSRSKTSVGVIGLGIIGTRVIANLRNAGYEVWLWNRSPRMEPNFLPSAREVAECARIIQFFVSDGTALLEAIDNMSLSLTPAHLLINHATILPEESREAARRARQVGARFIDAPFTGSRDAAGKASLVFYVGGNSTDIEEARPILSVSSKEIIVIGEVGEASAIKIATNLVTASIVQSLAEALAILHREGVAMEKFDLAMGSNASRSTTSDMKLPSMAAGDFEVRFSLKHMLKDVQHALRIGEIHQLELPLASAFSAAAMAGIQRGWADDDFSAVARHYNLPGAGLPLDMVASDASTPMAESSENTALEKKGLLQSFFGKK
ncbi:MAG: NAD(P)-dependent oxidoreductase [Chthoniobacterales bacterium]